MQQHLASMPQIGARDDYSCAPPAQRRAAPPAGSVPPAYVAAEAVVPHREEQEVVVKRRPGPHPPLHTALRRGGQRRRPAAGWLLQLLQRLESSQALGAWLLGSGKGATSVATLGREPRQPENREGSIEAACRSCALPSTAAPAPTSRHTLVMNVSSSG